MNTIGRRALSVATMLLLLSSQCLWASARERGGRDRNDSDGAASAASQANLNLRSRERIVTAGQNMNFNSATLQVGRSTRTVTPTDLLTHAEHVALNQVLMTGQQSLVLGRHGNAVRGSFQLTPDVSQGVHDMIVPRGVTAITDAASSALNITGNLINAGRLYAITSSPSTTQATIGAANIHNRQGAVISSILPGSGLNGMTSASNHLDLMLNAVHDIINYGTISSSGNLSLAAGGRIVNALPAGASGPAPTIQAIGNVNLASANIVNAGMISAITGSINIASQMANNLVVDSSGGTFKALSGAINIGSPSVTDKIGISVVGGNFLSQTLNAFAGTGTVNMNVEDVTGIVNVCAGEAHITASTNNLRLGTLTLTGDPTFFNLNANGDITLSAASITTNGFDLAIVASRNINILSGTTLDTIGAGTAGDILLIAGVEGTPVTAGSPFPPGGPDTATQLLIIGPSQTGGDINISGSSQIKANDSVQAGDVSLFAFTGAGGVRGNVVIESGSGIASHSTAAAKNGNVLIAAAGTSTGIQTGSIDTELFGTGGSISINAANPEITGPLQIANGSIVTGSIGVGALTNGNIHVNAALFSGGPVTVKTDDGSITADLNVIGHSVALNASANGSVTVNGIIAGTGSKAASDNITLSGASITINPGGQVRSGNQVLTDVPIFLNANTITNNGSIASGDDVTISHFFDQDPIVINVKVTGSGDTSAAGTVHFAPGVTNLQVLQHSMTGKLNVPIGLHTIDFSVATGGLNFISPLETDHKSGNMISLNAKVGDIIVPTIDATGSQATTGGTVTINAPNLVVSGQLANGASIDVSAPADGNGGTVSISTSSINQFVVGASAGPNRTLGHILANGGNNGGKISITNQAGGMSVINGATVSANGKSGNGGTIVLSGGGAITSLTVGAGSSITASNNADNSGTIAIAVGPGGDIVVSGTGTIQAGKVVKVGSIDPTSLKFVSPKANSVNIGNQLTIGNKIDLGGGGGPILIASSNIAPGSLAGLPFAAPAPAPVAVSGQPLDGSLAIQKLPTDQTPVDDGQSYILASKLPAVLAGPTGQVIVATEVETDNFDPRFIAALTSQSAGTQIGSQTGGSYLDLERGTLLFTPQNDIVVKLVEGHVFIAGGSHVLIMETGADETGADPYKGESAVYDLHDLYKGAVRVVANKKEIALTPGKQVVLTKKLDAKFEEVNPGLKIAYRNVRSEEVGGGIKAFAADFSIPSAMTRVDPLRRYLVSKQGKNRAVANQLLKNAVLMANMGGTEPYKSGQ